MFTIRVDKANDELKHFLKKLDKRQTSIAISRAINRTLSHGVSQYKAKIRTFYNVKNADLTGARINKSYPGVLLGSIGLSRRPLGLSHFNPRFDFSSSGSTHSVIIRSTKKGLVRTLKNKTTKRKSGVTIEVSKGRKTTIPYAFMLKSKNAIFARGQYQRSANGYAFIQRHKRINKTGPDTPISALISTSVSGMAANPLVNQSIKKDLTKFYTNRAVSEIKNILR